MCGGALNRSEDAQVMIKGASTDSRTISEGCLYVPLAGERVDGHDFAAQALAAGAGAVLWQRGKGTPPEGPAILVEDTLQALQTLASAYLKECGTKVVGITGSNGKTTVKDMVTALLGTRFRVHKTQGNFNSHVGLPLTVLSMPEDTEIAVLEMGMSGRHEIELLSSIANPDVAVITNIGEAHLLQLGSREEIARAKLEIISGMKPGGVLIFHGDEPLLHRVLAEDGTKKPEGLQTVTFGNSEQNDDYPTGIMFHGKGIIFTSHLHSGEGFSLPLLGRHNVINALSAMAVARCFSITDEQIREGLAELKLTSMRIECIETAHGVTVLNDAYNASPVSVKAALDVLADMKGCSRRIAVLGDMLELGPDEQEFHSEIGRCVTDRHADILFTYGPLSLHMAEAAKANLPSSQVKAYTDKQQLIQALLEEVSPNDVVLVKASRGMKLEEIVDALKGASSSGEVRG